MTGKDRCLYCYQVLADDDRDFHPACSKKFFGTPSPVLLPFDKEKIDELAKEIVIKRNVEMEMRAKLSVDIKKLSVNPSYFCFAIMGSGGRFILKPSLAEFPFLSELEDLSMHLAALAGIKTASHSLIRLQSGELVYISLRNDRPKKGKLPMEDMCQLTGTLTEDKYHSSMENIGKVIHAYSSNPGLDVISFFELTLFCFLTGSAHMHLKSLSLLSTIENDIALSPAQDLVPTHLIFSGDQDQLALSVNGKKRKLQRSDFDSLSAALKINPISLSNTYERMLDHLPRMISLIDISFLSKSMKQKYKLLIQERAKILFLDSEISLIKETDEEILEKIETVIVRASSPQITDKQNQNPSSRQLQLFD
jgi:serine/threonine-protein kinase HipA